MRLRNFSLLVAALSFAVLALAALILALRDNASRPIHVHVAAPTVVPPAVTVNHPDPADDDGMRVLNLGTGSKGESTLAVVRRAENPALNGERGWTLTFYRFSDYHDRGYLRHMGTRYIEDDMGFDYANITGWRGTHPADFRNRHAATRSGQPTED